MLVYQNFHLYYQTTFHFAVFILGYSIFYSTLQLTTAVITSVYMMHKNGKGMLFLLHLSNWLAVKVRMYSWHTKLKCQISFWNCLSYFDTKMQNQVLDQE